MSIKNHFTKKPINLHLAHLLLSFFFLFYHLMLDWCVFGLFYLFILEQICLLLDIDEKGHS